MSKFPPVLFRFMQSQLDVIVKDLIQKTRRTKPVPWIAKINPLGDASLGALSMMPENVTEIKMNT